MEATQQQTQTQTLVNASAQSVAAATSNTESSVLMTQLIEEAKHYHNIQKTWLSTLKKLSKEMEREKKKLVKQKPKRKVKQKPQQVTTGMQRFMKKHAPKELELEHGDSYTRQIMMKSVSSYIKTKKLQNEANKKQWSGKDSTLKKLFSLDSEWYTFMQINGLLSRVVIKA